jgi:cell division protein ZapE
MHSLKNKIIAMDLHPDQYQSDLIMQLDQWIEPIQNHESFSGRFLSAFGYSNITKDGLYIWGGVGRGKSIIASIFFETVQVKNKQRFHFHQFMILIHKALQNLRDTEPDLPGKKLMRRVIASMLPQCDLIFLDELQINNIADAMIVERLFKALARCGIFTVITSNRKPEELYQDGLNRERFIPFINRIINNFMVYHLDGNHDYRGDNASKLSETYFHPINSHSNNQLNKALSSITDPNKLSERHIFIDGKRELRVLACYGSTAAFNFSELCDMPLWAADYMAICQNFRNIIIKGIPKLSSVDHNQALRFITLIDCMYECKTRLICTAETSPEKIYSGKQHRFEFDRTISRLKEMHQTDYISYELNNHN